MIGAHTAPKNTAIADPARIRDEIAKVTPKNAPTPAALAVQKNAGRSAAIMTPIYFAATSWPDATAAVAGKVSVVAAVIMYSASK